MPVDLDDLILQRTKEIPVKDAAGNILFTVWASPDRVDLKISLSLRSASVDDDEQAVRIIHSLAIVITKWDLTRSGKPVPITDEEIAKLGSVLILTMNQAVNDGLDFLGKAIGRNGNSSDATSSIPTSPAADAPVTTSESEQPDTPASP